jgi:MSHA biogenesis protein MshK
MAQVMKTLCALMLAVLASAAAAQDGTDPTRPPALMTPAPVAPGSTPLVRLDGAPQLQSILVSLRPGGRRVAVIDGKTVRQGQRVGDAVLVAIGNTEVVLRRAGKNQILKLFRPAPQAAVVQP